MTATITISIIKIQLRFAAEKQIKPVFLVNENNKVAMMLLKLIEQITQLLTLTKIVKKG